MTRLRTVLLAMFTGVALWGAGPAPAPVNDGGLERAIRAKFDRSKIRVEGFTVRVERGTAILEGKTKVIQRKGTATRLARLAGARAVDNRIQVDESARERASENLAQGRRRAQVKRGETRSERKSGPTPTPPVAAAPVVKDESGKAGESAAPRRAKVVAGK